MQKNSNWYCGDDQKAKKARRDHPQSNAEKHIVHIPQAQTKGTQ